MISEIVIDRRAEKEIRKLPLKIQYKIDGLLKALSKQELFSEKVIKKLKGYSNLYEIRIKAEGQWRILFAYLEGRLIIILCVFHKKTQKTPRKYLSSALQRFKLYTI